MHLPSFLWLWRTAAWSMGFAIVAFCLLALTGLGIASLRLKQRSRPRWLYPFHVLTGIILVALVLLLLGIGLVGTIGHYGDLGHSSHLAAGLSVVWLTGLSAGSAIALRAGLAWARSLHVFINSLLFIAMVWVSWTGWLVVQKYIGG